jgi:hypothetical protein
MVFFGSRDQEVKFQHNNLRILMTGQNEQPIFKEKNGYSETLLPTTVLAKT